MRLQHKTCLVTGGGSGLGRAIAQRFCAEGARVAVVGRRAESLEGTVAAVRAAGFDACAIAGDITLPAFAAHCVGEVISRWGRLDVLVNSAGTVIRKPCAEMSIEEWDRVMDINLRAVFLMCHEALPHMVTAGGGAIVNIASISAVRGQPSACSYSASKAGLVNFARSIANDYGRHGIRANNILPGLVETELSRSRLKPGETWDE
ncbi:MAG: SDR family NAD(P)-dependent oxidoreductase, partial [Gammaproteobacteria bacterium]